MGPRIPSPNPTWETTLHALRLTGTLYCRAELSAPWGIAIPDLSGVMLFGILTEGAAWVQHGRKRRAVSPGSLWLFPRGRSHRIYSEKEAPLVPLNELPVEPISERYESLRHGGGGAYCQITYGILRFDEVAGARLVALLPDVLHIDTQDGQVNGWLKQTVGLIAHEARTLQLGGDTVLTSLADVIVIQALRAWLSEAASHERGWLAALRDERIGRALTAFHQSPGQDWTVERLGAVAGLCRSVFSLRFHELVGEPVMTYVSAFRMETARARLRDTDEPLASIAERLGYRSEAAFGRAFKRETGTSPGRWRKSSRRLCAPETAGGGVEDR